MAKIKNTGLGRGLDSIFLDNTVEQSGVSMLRLSMIEPNPDQPRKQFDDEALEELANSIAANGLIEPIVVRSAKTEGYYQIISGERRWRACKMAGLTEVPVVINEMEDKKAAQIALIENVMREDLNPVEEARGYKDLTEKYGMTQEEIAEQIGKKSRSAITNSLRLLDLPEKVLDMVAGGKISAGHGRTLLGLKDREQILPLAIAIESKGLSVREVEKAVKKLNRGEKKPENTPVDTGEVDYTAVLETKMTRKLGTRVSIKTNADKKSGKLEISYSDAEGLNGLITLLCGENIFDD